MRSAELTQLVFKAADVVRGTMNPADSIRLVSAVFVLRWASEHPDALTVPTQASWDGLTSASPVRDALDNAVAALVASNRDVLDNSFGTVVRDSRLSDTDARLLIAAVDEIPGRPDDDTLDDVSGELYEQLLTRFVDTKGRGESTTPRSVAQLMVRLADPRPDDSVYDPCAGTGGLLTAAAAYVTEQTGQHDTLHLFGQDVDVQACTFARLNLLMHGITDATVLSGDAIADPRHLTSAGSPKRFDRVLAEPPFGVRYAREEPVLPQQSRYGWSRSADLMFVQHVLASLAPDGVGVVVVPNGVLFRGGAEGHIRREMVTDSRIAAVIAIGGNVLHGTSIPACVLVLRGEEAARACNHDVLFIDAGKQVDVMRLRSYLAPRHIEKIANAFHGQEEIPHFSRLVPIDEIATNEFTLSIAKYVDLPPPTRPNLNISALLAGDVPLDEVNAQRERFATFGINIADLFAPSRPGYLTFSLQGHDTVAKTISAQAATRINAFASAVDEWFEEFRQEHEELGSLPFASAGEHFAGKFQDALRASPILDNEQIAGLFADWWASNRDDLNLLRRRNASTPSLRGAAFDRIRSNLAARTRTLVAQELQQLIDAYRTWSDQYKTSLTDLELRREQVTRRLAERLDHLGYRWPIAP